MLAALKKLVKNMLPKSLLNVYREFCRRSRRGAYRLSRLLPYQKKLNFSTGQRILLFCEYLENAGYELFLFRKDIILDQLSAQKNMISKTRIFAEFGVSSSNKHYARILNLLIRRLNACTSLNYEDYLKAFKTKVMRCTKRELNVVFLLHESQVMPSIESVCWATEQDTRFCSTIVYAPLGYGRHAWKNSTPESTSKVYPTRIVSLKKYSFLHDSPDIVVLTRPFIGEEKKIYAKSSCDIFELATPQRCGFRTVYVPYAFYDTLSDFAIKYGYQMNVPSNAWRIVAYSPQILQNYQTYSIHKGKRAALLGAPRFDVSSGINGYKNDEFTTEYAKKIRGRRTLFWNPHFKYSSRDCAVYIAYLKQVLSFFSSHPDLFLFWRPHPMMFSSLVEYDVMTKTEVDSIIEKTKQAENILIDDSRDYINAFALSDAMLTDGDSSLPYEYVATEKPVFIHYVFGYDRKSWQQKYEGKMPSLYYPSFSVDDLDKALSQFAAKKDPDKTNRLEAAREFIYENDGQAGQRVKNYLYDELMRDEQRLALSITDVL